VSEVTGVVGASTGDPTPARVALVTGASRGIGRALALGLAADGLAVGLLARDGEALDLVVEEIEAAGGRAARAVADVTELAAVTSAVGRLVAELGPIDLLVDNAGVIDDEVPLWEADPAQWRRVVETNLVGSFHVSRVVLASMVERGGGRSVELASGAGAKDLAVASAYTASKAALIRTVGGVHLAGHALGLRAFAVAPGVVATDMSTGMRMHAGRTEFTPVERVVDLVRAIAGGELDAWSGRYLRVTHDTPETLAAHGAPGPRDRTLGVLPWGLAWESDDPLAD